MQPDKAEQLSNIASLAYFGPELALIAGALLVILWDLFVKPHQTKVLGTVFITLVALAYSAGVSLFYVASSKLAARELFDGLIAFDDYTNTFRAVFGLAAGIIVLFIAPLALTGGPHSGERRNAPEMLTLLLVLTLGMNLMAASRNMLMIYLSLEMVSVISFVLAGFKIRDRKSSEGALKYVIYGGVASGIMLYGMSWIYGLTRTLNLSEIYLSIRPVMDPALGGSATAGPAPEAVLIGVVCMLAGFGYKISAAPFHMWTPDVYEGAPTPITAFLSVAPKAAGMAVLIRFFADALGASWGQLIQSVGTGPWAVIAGCIAMATMTIGNLSALHQDNVKRMLAYSSIAHAGYMLLGFSIFSEAGVKAIVFYIIVYCFMNLGAFLVVMSLSEVNGGDETIEAFRGLGRRAPVLAAMMTIFLVSLAGIPPLAGFVGKFYLFAAVIDAATTAYQQASTALAGWCWVLAIVGIINSVVSLFYYARVLRAMFLDEVEVGVERIRVRSVFGGIAVALALPTLVLGMYWAPLYDFVDGSLSRARAVRVMDQEAATGDAAPRAQHAGELERPAALTKTGHAAQPQ